MLARSGELPTDDAWAYELKLDGFRAIVSTVDGLRVRSRRGWNMTLQLLELSDLPDALVLDGEVVAFNRDGLPHFPDVCRRMLHHDETVPITFVAFDVLHHDGQDITSWPYFERRALLESLELDRRTGARSTRSTTARLYGRLSANWGSRASSRSGCGRCTGRGSAALG